MASEKPFKPLEEFTEGSPGGFALIKQAKENPDVLVKDIAILSDDNEENNQSGSVFLEHYDFETFKREIVDPIKFLQERGFNKFIPEVQPVWGKDENGEEKGFLVMKRVRGIDIEDLEKISLRIANELDIFISKSFEIESESLMSGEDIISPDILATTESGPSLANIMIGKVSGDKEEHVYLIDLYPMKGYINYFKKKNLAREEKMWLMVLDNLSAKTESGHDFPLSNAALKKYLAALKDWKEQEILKS